MELVSEQTEKLYRINKDEYYSRERIINHKVKEAMKILPEHWRSRNFEMITNPILKVITEKLMKWNFENPIVSSIISKQNGIGKSFIATCMIRKYFYDVISLEFDNHFVEWNENEEGMYYYGYNGVLTFMQSTYDHHVKILDDKKMNLEIQETFNRKKSETTQKSILDNFVKYKFLVIDDMFSNRTNEFARQNILYVLDERIEYENKPTFITSNLTLSEIADIDTRIADRINNSMLFQIDKEIESHRKNF